MSAPLRATSWFPLGPFGGDARTIVADPRDPRHLYLGTATGWIFSSSNGGETWERLAQIGKRSDLVIDCISVDPRNPQRMLVGAHITDRPDGGMFLSNDGGKSWYEQAEMHSQSVRSLGRSASIPDELVAGTLTGVYRSLDNGQHWRSISPQGNMEIKEVESIAIDPTDPQVIYAGTWHLPWKTVDGGAHWENITKAQGIIDDSDVFSIIVDPMNPKIVYASACSGIYKSVNAGGGFTKVTGIPASARRTRKLMQDPQNLSTVYAGTTEGLYRTIDGGATWSRMTDPDVIVNDVFVDPRDANHVLIATDRAGVLSSFDGGVSFQASNAGFTARQVTAFSADPRNRATVYVGVVNDKATGGVFQSLDGGVRWQQQSVGLGGRDVFSLASTVDGTLLAGTGHGIFRLDAGAWTDSSTMVPGAPAPKPVARAQPAPKKTVKGKPVRVVAKPAPPVAKQPVSARLDTVVYTLVPGENEVFAGTYNGLVRGDAAGKTWSPVNSLQMPETRFVAAQKSVIAAASMRRLELSLDDGATWDVVALPTELTQISAVAVDELNNLWVGGPEGAFYSTDYGLTWKTLPNLYVTQVDGMYFDAAEHRVLVTAANTTFVFAAHIPDYKVSAWDTGWNLRFVRPVGDHLLGATFFDGVVLQPRMVDSSLVNDKTASLK
jgi:photosystem II stability/assembly factor-like uncharacterized protein